MRATTFTTPVHASRPSGAFTLVEVVVVIAIVSVLAAVLLPSLAGAREAARSGVCASNVRQLLIALDSYATDHAERYAPGAPDFAGNLTRWHGARSSPAAAFSPEGGSLSGYLGGSGGGGEASTLVRACPTFAPVARALASARVGFERAAGGYGYNLAFVGTDRAVAGTDPGTGRAVWGVVTDRVGAARWRFTRPSSTIGFGDSAIADGNAVAGVVEYSFLEPRFWPDAPSQRADPSLHFRHGGGRAQGLVANVAWLDGHVGAQKRTFTWSSGVYSGNAGALGTGWTGDEDSNALFETR